MPGLRFVPHTQTTSARKKFSLSSHLDILRVVFGAIDGCLIWQKNRDSSIENTNRYYWSRKDEFLIPLMELADAKGKFQCFNMSCTPIIHDSLAFCSTNLGYQFEKWKLPEPLYIIRDNAFTFTTSLVARGQNNKFNYKPSSLREVVEWAFGEIIQRWGVLWIPL